MWEHIWDEADCLRNSLVFGPMVHELFNEDLGIPGPRLKGPYGSEQLLAVTPACTWRPHARTFAKYASSNYTRRFPVPPEPSV